MISLTTLPSLVRAKIVKGPEDESLGLRIKQGEEGAILIYYIEPESPASRTDLREGAEILSINDHRVRSPRRCIEMLTHYAEARGKVEILVSVGNRPRGTLYIMAKNVSNKDKFSGTDSVIDGLEVEEKGGHVRVTTVPDSGFFRGLHINKSDIIWSIDGSAIHCVDDARRALKAASKPLIPILTYNSFRKLKTTVMSDTSRVLKKDAQMIGTKGKTVKIEELYNVGEKLGEGAFAVVKKATHKQSDKPYAIKIVNRASLDKDMETALKDEIFILNELNHENIMNLHNVIVTINHYYLVTEFLEGGELFDRIVEKTTYTESEARDVCKVLFEALEYCHSKRIVHRDLKPENLLLQYKDSDSEIKIADFGFAKKAPTEHSLSTVCGTPGYVAPELLRMEKYGTKSDLWSMGIIVFILLGGYPPFYADNERELFRLTKRGKFDFEEAQWKDISDEVKNLISSLLVTDPSKRASATDILQHPWMKKNQHALQASSLANSQNQLKRFIAKRRFKMAIHSVIFLTNFSGENAVFSNRNKYHSISTDRIPDRDEE